MNNSLMNEKIINFFSNQKRTPTKSHPHTFTTPTKHPRKEKPQRALPSEIRHPLQAGIAQKLI